jgi:DNA polymerase-3 subunit epsilon
MYLVFDTETSGMANFRRPPSDPSQPHLVQLGAILFSDEHRVLQEINLIVKPEGFTIPKEASDIHGITQEMAMSCGLPLWIVISMFREISNMAPIHVAHNLQFDAMIISASVNRVCDALGALAWIEHEGFCTMKTMTPICKLKGPFGFKWPNLQEAHEHATGSLFEGAHDAMADVRACAKVYRWLKEQPKLAPDPVK